MFSVKLTIHLHTKRVKSSMQVIGAIISATIAVAHNKYLTCIFTSILAV